LVDTLAVARITRLVVADTITEDVRTWAALRLQVRGHEKVAYLLECPWCAGMWVSLAVALAHRSAAWKVLRWPLAASYAAGFLSGYER
jgi:hypothetical protein